MTDIYIYIYIHMWRIYTLGGASRVIAWYSDTKKLSFAFIPRRIRAHLFRINGPLSFRRDIPRYRCYYICPPNQIGQARGWFESNDISSFFLRYIKYSLWYVLCSIGDEIGEFSLILKNLAHVSKDCLIFNCILRRTGRILINSTQLRIKINCKTRVKL